MEKKIEYFRTLATEDQELKNEVELLLIQLPKATNWNGLELCKYQGFWLQSKFLSGTITFQRHFKAQETDIILVTFPKSGTTWLKALVFTIVNRFQHEIKSSPLLTKGPHELVPFLDFDLYMRNELPDLDNFPKPRIFATHLPYASLPNSIKDSNCRIIYLCRNPMDQFISHWKFSVGLGVRTTEPVSLDEAFEMVCNGCQNYGPIWEHVLGYWKATKEETHKILFLNYEELKEDSKFYVKRLADLLGCPFSKDEESKGKIKEISKFCSFDNMKNLEVNKSGHHPSGVKNDMFFRKGLVGDWKNYLTPSMSERLEKLMEEKFSGSGFTFKKS